MALLLLFAAVQILFGQRLARDPGSRSKGKVGLSWALYGMVNGAMFALILKAGEGMLRHVS